MALSSGDRIGPYEVQGALGAGGMGEVYRARDSRLGRDVALKVLPEQFAVDPERLARFKREAQVLASLNHPNIGAIYGFEEASGFGPAQAGHYVLVLELVEGPTLADRIAQGPIPLEDALPIARQIAEALEAAHEHGVIHRDLKPANIKLRPDGTVKVLDFGLAKALEGEPTASASFSIAPTITSPAMTRLGMILGTAAYMSPEQARGKTTDKRTDVWAFGCVLYEMLTGKRLFDGDEVTDVLARVIEREPDFTALPKATPPVIRHLLRRCLEKDRSRRLPDIGVARLDISELLAGRVVPTGEAAERPARASSRRTALLLAAGLVLGAVAAGVAVYVAMTPDAPPIARLMIAHADASIIGGGNIADPDVAITPDGRRVVYVTGDGSGQANAQRLWVRALDQLEPFPLASASAPRSPFLSPDGSWVAFFEGPSLKKVSIAGGPAIVICAVPGAPRGASWGADDTIVFATGDVTSGLFRVSAGGGTAEPLTMLEPNGTVDHLFPEILPGGQGVLYSIVGQGTGAGETSQVALLDLRAGSSRVLLAGGSHARYVPSGHLVFGASGTLRAVRFDLDALEIRGDPVPVLQRVVTKTTGAASFGIASNGTLVYVAGDSQDIAERTLVWVDRQGREEPINVPPRTYTYARISPDGTQAALDVREQENDIWLWSFGRQTLTRLTFTPGFNRSPVWTPDGRRLAFSAATDKVETIYWQTADGSGMPERLVENSNVIVPGSFSPDGKWLVFNQPAGAPYDLGVIALDPSTSLGAGGARRAQMLLTQPFSEHNGVISPNGRWLAYQSNESGEDEVYVRPFPDVNSGRWQVSTKGGTRPLWSRNGRELFYYNPPGRMMAVPVLDGSGFSMGVPQQLFEGQYISANTGRTYDVSADGRRFLLIKRVARSEAAAPPPQLVVVQNWLEELKRLVPAN